MIEKLNRAHWILLAVNLLQLAAFGIVFAAGRNTEFIIYTGVVLFFILLIGLTIRKVGYTFGSLIGLTVWATLHLAGGGISIGDGVLYDVILFPLSETWPIVRYDQLVHIWGFGTATVVMFDVFRSVTGNPLEKPIATGVLLVMAGLGIGALNEIVEFLVSTALPESNVGGYLNTSLDLCADLIGALLALICIRLRAAKN